MPMIGRTLTHYKVVAELGAGGMGVVYEAVDLRLDRHVALKILPPDKSDDHDRRARFLHEARAASALNDPHIVTIFDIFTEDDGTDVLVMELVQGRTLRDILNDGPMAVARVVDVALQVAEGVGTAHAAGIVHRDLKPGNVMVTDRGRVKVLDFGLAKLVGGASFADQATTMAPTTVAGMLLGTVDYMSPEQAKGDPIDARSDVFSLGAMLYEMLTRERPFVASHPLGVLHEILYGAIVSPRTRRPEIAADLDAVVLRSLERDLAKRYPSMESFASDLRRVQRSLETSEQTVATPTASPITPTTSPVTPSPSTQTSTSRPQPTGPLPSRPIVVEGPTAFERPAVAERPGMGAGFGGATFGSSLPPVAMPGSLPPSWSKAAAKAAARMAAKKGRRLGAKAGRRSGNRWAIWFVILMIFFGLRWTRSLFSGDSRAYRPPSASAPRIPRPPADSTDSTRPSDEDRIGTAVEDVVTGALDAAAPNSAPVQLARAKIFWERAQRNHDAALTQKAEDTFNEVLRLKPDAEVESQARDALREIAASKEAPPAP
jgi:serine/threonine-protein kinase